MGDWAYATAITVWAYQEGGATAVGVFQAVRFVAMAVAGPLGAVVADRVPRKTFMLVTDLTRAVLVGAAAVIITLDGPAIGVYALGVVAAMVGAPFRSAQAGLIPRLVNAPDELTASNAVASNLENIVLFVGPALGALLVGVSSVETVFWLNVALLPVVLPAGRVRSGCPHASRNAGSRRTRTSPSRASSPRSRPVSPPWHATATCAPWRCSRPPRDCVWGALTVFMVIIAIELLEAGPQGVGYLNAVMGAATILGGVIVLSRVGKGRLGQDMAIGVLGWSLPLLALAASPRRSRRSRRWP